MGGKVMVNNVCYIHYFLYRWAPITNLDFEIGCEFELPQVSNNFIFHGLHAFSVQHLWQLKENTLDHVLSS